MHDKNCCNYFSLNSDFRVLLDASSVDIVGVLGGNYMSNIPKISEKTKIIKKFGKNIQKAI